MNTINLKNARLAKDYTQNDVAKKLDIPLRTLGSYEQGTREPNHEMLIKLARFYGVTTDYLLGYSLDESSEQVKQSTIDKLAREFNLSELEKNIIIEYSKLSSSTRKEINLMIENLIEHNKQDNSVPRMCGDDPTTASYQASSQSSSRACTL